MPSLSSQGIFLSYRREDAAPYARLLQFQLRERFRDVQVFMDLDSIEAGLDFAEVIREAVDSCAVLVALIGRQWATLSDEEGHRRLDNPDDFVRFEVQVALERGVRVIPLLVDGARPLRQQQLPSELQKLARLNALELSYGRYEYDADRLLNIIHRVLDEASGTGTMHQSPPAADVDVRPDGNAPGHAAQKDLKLLRKIMPAPPGSSPMRNASPSPSPTKTRRPARSPISRGHWRSPTRIAPPGSSPMRNASPSPSPTKTRRPARSPWSRGRWRPPTRTAPPGSSPMRNASPSPSPTNSGRTAALRRRRERAGGHRPGPMRNASPSPSPTNP